MNRKFFVSSVIMVALVVFTLSGIAHAAQYIQMEPLEQVIKIRAGSVIPGKKDKLPLITWGGDEATILANGNAINTQPGSIFSQKGLNFELVWMDDFKKQVEMFIAGDMWLLRGTMGMINMASAVCAKDPKTELVVIYQLTWSNGGDCLVVKKGINTVKDLKGKTVVLQAYGPHVDYLVKLLADAGLSINEVNVKYVKDLTGTANSPAEAFYTKDVDAVFCIIPDGLALTEGDDAVIGAKILMSTKTANRVISDVYAARKDYFEANRDKVQKLVHGLMLAEQELGSAVKGNSQLWKDVKTATAKILLESPDANEQAVADAEALYYDCQFVGYRGNVKYFGDTKWPRNFSKMADEIQTSFVAMGLLSSKVALTHAKLSYDQMRAGLVGVDDIEAPRFKTDVVAKVIEKKAALGTLEEGELFNFEINFKPNQKVFSADMYSDEFDKVVELSATYGGAVISVEGHSDPHKINKLKKKGSADFVIKRTQQAAKNLSVSRALSVRNTVIKYAEGNGVPLDKSQFTVIGHGVSQPLYPNPKTKEQWLRNMRVVFRIIQIEAEEEAFEPIE
ncbi:MAG: ABC transporter substrate-binding protein [Desulfobacterales bacterium]|jgi:outer membrane protein OmpA-like peptidoglycan-associated protein